MTKTWRNHKLVQQQYWLAICTMIVLALILPDDAVGNEAQLTGPDAVENTLSADGQEKQDIFNVHLHKDFDAWKTSIKEQTGLDFGFDYNVLGFRATNSLGEDRTASGVFRLYGYWDLFGRGTPNSGGLVFKFENRHKFTDVAPTDFGEEIGYLGLPNSVFNDQDWRTTNLFWKQRFAGGKGVSYVGFLDVTDYVDVFALASPWTSFSNLAFQTGTGTIPGLPDGALGAMAGAFLTKNMYAMGGLADINADPTQIGKGFKTFFDDFETLKTFEIGLTTGQDRLFLDNFHLTFWHIDESLEAGNPEGWGVSFSFSKVLQDHWLAFARGGWAHNGGSIYEAAVSAGFGYSRQPGQDLFAVGVNWSRPNQDTFGAGLQDQWAVEVFQKLQLTEGIAITPSVQLIMDPTFNPINDTTALFGLRTRAAF